MRRVLHFFCFAFFAAILLCSTATPAFASADSKESPRTYLLAVNNSVIPLLDDVFIKRTVQTLQKAVAPDHLRVEFVPLPQLESMVKNRQTDFIIATSNMSRRYAEYGPHDMVTASSPFSRDPNRSEGSLFIVRSDRNDIEILADLQNRKAAAGRPTAFAMYLAGLGEIASQGYEPYQFFSEVNFFGTDKDEVIRSVLRGESDVGILRACYMEDALARGIFNEGELKFINLKNDPVHQCQHSTSLYPNWTLSSMPSVAPELASRVTQALLMQSATERNLYWAVASDFTELDRLQDLLKIGAFERVQASFFEEYKYVFAGFLAAFLLLAAHSLLVSRAVRRKTADLQKALSEQKLLFEQAETANRRMLAMQKAGVVGQVSSMIAHELRQPLSTVSCYTHALVRAAERGILSNEILTEKLSVVREEALRANAIVERVRSYAKDKNVDRTKIALADFAAQFCDAKEQAGVTPHPELIVEARPSVVINPLELELVLHNLVKNAREVLVKLERKNPKITVTVAANETRALLRIEDNGAVSDDELEQLSLPVFSTKAEGLGLGLSIVKGIVENHGGRIVFTRNTAGGLTAEVRLPLAEKSDESH